jgi:RHS repeat-associated protein
MPDKTGASGFPGAPGSAEGSPQRQSSLATPPSISLPKGGGAIRGIDEKFSANPVTGTGTMTVPIATSAGRAGFGPALSLSYDSGAGNGPFGFGWSLSLPSITRKTEKGLPRYRDGEESDVFLLSGADDLVPVFRQDVDGTWVAAHAGHRRDPDGAWVRDAAGRFVVHEDDVDGYRVRRYRPRIEGLFARLERWSRLGDPADVHWRSLSKENLLTLYGLDLESRIVDPLEATRIFSWLVCETRDDRGNAILYRYAAENGTGVDLDRVHERNRGPRDDPRRTANRYLKRVHYGNQTPLLDGAGTRPRFLDRAVIATQIANAEWMFEVVVDYGEHDAAAPKPDDAGDWAYRLDPFSTYRAAFELRTTRLCQRVLMFHHFPNEASVRRDCLVGSTDFTYSDEVDPTDARNPVYAFLEAVTHTGYIRDNGGYSRRSLPQVEFEYSRPTVRDAVEQLDAESLENIPIGLDGVTYRWTDLHGEGIPGILTEQAGAWFYKRNLSPLGDRRDGRPAPARARFAALETVATKPAVALARGAEFMDLAGDGQPDVVVLSGPNPGLYEHDDAEGWQPFRPFTARPTRDLRDPNLRFMDVDGDGHADVLISEDDALVWYPSLAEDGFGPAARAGLAAEEELGPRVVFADASQSVSLADLSGDGLTDIVRIRNGEVCYWPNLGYGRFGAKVTMDNAPLFDQPDQFHPERIRLADIDGSGTTDIIYLHRDGVRLYFNQSGNSWSAPHTLNVSPRIDDLVSIVAVDLLGNHTSCLVWSSPLPGDTRSPMRYVNLMGAQKPHLLVRSINNLGAETRIDYAPSTRFYLQDKRDGHPWVTRLPFPVHVVERLETIDHISRTRFTARYAYHHGYYDGEEREFRGFGMVEQHDTESFEDYVIGVKHTDGIQDVAPELYQPPVTTKTWYHTGALLEEARILHQFRHEYYQQHALLFDGTLPPNLSTAELRECVRALKGLPLRVEVYSYDGSLAAEHPYTVAESAFEVRRVQSRGEGRHGVFFPVGREALGLDYERSPVDPRVSHTFHVDLDEYGNPRKSCSVAYGRAVVDASLPPEVQAAQRRAYVTMSEGDYTPDFSASIPAETYRLRVPFELRTYEITGIGPSATLFRIDEIRDRIAVTAPIDYEIVADGVTAQKRLLSHSRTVFRDNALAPMPLGQWDTLALGFESYQLAFTPGVTAAHFAAHVNNADFAAAGYVHFAGDTNWWIPSGTAIYPANPRAHFYLPNGSRMPLGIETVGTLDQYHLLMNRIEVVQAPWNVVTATNDYRVLGPVLVTDPNGNRSAVEHDELGMVVKAALMGKAGSNDGDTLADPTSRMEYELFNWMNSGTPNSVHTFLREQHGAGNPRWQESYAYSNGSGGVALAKSQAHPGKAFAVDQNGARIEVDADPRWIGNGRTIANNKGRPVKQYEPYFSTTHEYEDEKVLREIGATPVIFYDPMGRTIRTLFPNGTLARTDFSPWQERVFDANDTVLESRWYADRGSPDPANQPEPVSDPERRAAWLAAKHANTPGALHFDSLGKAIYSVSDYGSGKTAAVRRESDLTGRLSSLFDQQGREVASGVAGMAGPILAVSAEKGSRRAFANVLGAPVKSWDEHGRTFRAVYDELQRPLGELAHEAGQPERLLSYVVYGDRLTNAPQLNLLGATHQIFDQAGMVRIPQLDFKGNAPSVERVLAKDYASALDWSALAAAPDYAAIQAAAAPALDLGEVFAAGSQYDALNRPTRVTLPDGTVILPAYNEANILASLRAQIRGQGAFVDFLKVQDYDAKGQRQFAQYGNDTFTRYFYSPETFRLTTLLTFRSGSDPLTHGLQNLKYTYDPAGNIVQIDDDAQETLYFNNAVVSPENRFEYDAIYQLIRATGRELAGIGNDGVRTHADLDVVPQLPHLNNVDAVRTFTEEYEYDLLGNITTLRHRYQPQGGAGSGWTRHYHYAFDDTPGDRTNRLTASSMPGDPDAGPFSGTYDYDAYANMTRLPHLAALDWNVHEQLTRVDLGGGGTAHYVYGLGGERLRKVIERNGNVKLEWIFLGPVRVFRRRRRDTNALRLERWTVHIGDNVGHIAQVDTKTFDDGNLDPANPLNVALIRYQYTNHLGSAVLETDDAGTPISYEAYHPYGTTAYRSSKPGADLSLKPYRFSGKERDDESGLYYFGARYYAPWLGRWTSADPVGFADGLNLFRYCQNNPAGVKDHVGHKGQPPDQIIYSITSDKFKGTENPSVADFKRFVGSSFDKRINASNAHIDFQPNIRQDLESHSFEQLPGGTWTLQANIPKPPPPKLPAETAPTTTPPPVAPLINPTPVAPSQYQTSPVPKIDLPQAAPGTDFRAAESAGRAQYRANAATTGNPMAFGEQVQHPAKWRDGMRTNLDPRITNNQRFLHPIQSRSDQMGGRTHTIGGRTYRTDHTAADRGWYPREAADTQQKYGDYATERVTHVLAAKRVRQRSTGSRGPSFVGEYIVAPTLRGLGGHTALAATRTFVPFVAEAELGIMGAGFALYSMGYTAAGVAVFGAAAYVPVVGGSLVAGAYMGNVAESVAKDFGASDETAQSIGMLGAMGTGALVGALIGSVIPGVGTAAGALIGAFAGGIGYALSKWL